MSVSNSIKTTTGASSAQQWTSLVIPNLQSPVSCDLGSTVQRDMKTLARDICAYYGLLSATYLQQEAVVELYRLMNVPKLQTAKDAVTALKIRRVRNQLASHSVNYLNHASGQMEAFAPIHISLGGFHCQITSLTMEPPETIDLKESLKENTTLLVSLMDQTYEKSYKTLFKGQQKRLDEHKERLSDLRVAKNGGKVFRTPGGKVIIHTMAAV